MGIRIRTLTIYTTVHNVLTNKFPLKPTWQLNANDEFAFQREALRV